MNYQLISFEAQPETILDHAYDCVWLYLGGFDVGADGICNPSLQWIDWKLRGSISRSLLGDSLDPDAPLFIPSQGRLKSPFVGIWTGSEILPDVLKRNCEGQKWKSFLFYCTTPSRWEKVNAAFDKAKDFGAECFLTKG